MRLSKRMMAVVCISMFNTFVVVTTSEHGRLLREDEMDRIWVGQNEAGAMQCGADRTDACTNWSGDCSGKAMAACLTTNCHFCAVGFQSAMKEVRGRGGNVHARRGQRCVRQYKIDGMYLERQRLRRVVAQRREALVRDPCPDKDCGA